MKETDVGAATVRLLQGLSFEAYQEVLCAWGPCADIVATRGKLLIAVECKVQLSFEVMHQALRWVPYAHQCFVSVPLPRYGVHPLARRLLGDLGLGLIGVHDFGDHHAEIVIDARWNKHEACAVDRDRLRRALREEQKTFAPAGSSGAARWSPYKATCKDLREFVRTHEGCSLKEAIAGIRHHYSNRRSASGALVHSIRAGDVPGVRVEVEGRRLRLYPKPIERERGVA